MRKNKALLRMLSNPAVIRNHYSPSIPRSIPASQILHMTEWGIVALVSGILIVLILSLSVQINQQIKVFSEQQAEKQEIENEQRYWEGIVKAYPGYRDAYYKLALVTYQLGDEKNALIAINNALRLDPLFKEGRAFRERLLSE